MKIRFLIAVLIFVSVQVIAQDTLYIMKNGFLVEKYNVKTEIDSMIFYAPNVAPSTSTFTDARDGTVYKSVKIGNQEWMAENLRYLPSVVGAGTVSSSTPYYYVYNYNGTNVASAKATENYKTYGVLYNWAAIMSGAPSSTANPSGVQGICPDGWHVPSEAEWTQLINTAGGVDQAGYKLKEAGNAHWSINNGTDNQTGFTALPGGYLRNTNLFYDIGTYGNWSTATEQDGTNTLKVKMNYVNGQVTINGSGKEKTALSCRCVKD